MILASLNLERKTAVENERLINLDKMLDKLSSTQFKMGMCKVLINKQL